MKTYNNDCIGYRIACGKLVNKLIKADDKEQVINENRARFKDGLKNTIISILGIAYKKTENDFFLEKILHIMRYTILKIKV